MTGDEVSFPSPEQRLLNLQARGYSPAGIKTDLDSTPVTLYYKLHGTDSAPEKLIFIGGLGALGSDCDRCVAMLLSRPDIGADCQIVTFDHRCVGQSVKGTRRLTSSGMAKDALALMDHLKWERVHVFGASLGGMIGQELALMAPARICSLTMAVSHTGGPFSTPFRGVQLILGNAFESNVEKKIDRAMEILFSKLATADPASERHRRLRGILVERIQNYKDGFGSGKDALYQLAATQTHKVSNTRLARLKDFKFPIALITGDQDNLVKLSNSKKMSVVLGCELVIVPNCGHGIVFEGPGPIADLVSKQVERSRSDNQD